MIKPEIVVIGAGPVGLYLTYLITTLTQIHVTLYEMRDTYTRTRYVKLDHDLNSKDHIAYSAEDPDTISAILSDQDITDITRSRALTKDISDALIGDMLGRSVTLSSLESRMYGALDKHKVSIIRRKFSTDDIHSECKYATHIIDCTGYRSVLRDYVAGQESSKVDFILESALIVTFRYVGPGICDERCKYRRNIGMEYKFIPAIDLIHTSNDTKVVTGIISLDTVTHTRLSLSKPLTKDKVIQMAPAVDLCINNFMDKLMAESGGTYVEKSGSLLPIHLNLYRSKEFSRQIPNTKILLLGDSAIGSPYFQSLSLGLDGCKYLAYLLARDESMSLHAYDLYMRNQWLRVYTRSMQIKRNKHLLSMYGTDDILDLMHVF